MKWILDEEQHVDGYIELCRRHPKFFFGLLGAKILSVAVPYVAIALESIPPVADVLVSVPAACIFMNALFLIQFPIRRRRYGYRPIATRFREKLRAGVYLGICIMLGCGLGEILIGVVEFIL